MVLTGDEAIIYLYTLSEKDKKFEVNKYDYKKGGDEVLHADNEEDDEEEKKDEEQEQDNENNEQNEPEQETEQKEENDIKDEEAE